MNYRASLNTSKNGQPEVGYLPLNFLNFPHFQSVAMKARTNVIQSISNFGNMKVPRKKQVKFN